MVKTRIQNWTYYLISILFNLRLSLLSRVQTGIVYRLLTPNVYCRWIQRKLVDGSKAHRQRESRFEACANMNIFHMQLNFLMSILKLILDDNLN